VPARLNDLREVALAGARFVLGKVQVGDARVEGRDPRDRRQVGVEAEVIQEGDPLGGGRGDVHEEDAWACDVALFVDVPAGRRDDLREALAIRDGHELVSWSRM
jgi:hypothetical protein